MKKDKLYKKLFVLIFFSFILLIFFNISSGFITAKKSSRDIIIQKLKAVSHHVSTLIDGEAHKRICKNFHSKNAITSVDQSPEYEKIHNILADAHRLYELNSPIYTFIESVSHKGGLEFIVTSSKEPYFRHLYSTFPKDKFQQLQHGGVIDVYEDEFGKWLSAFYPIFDDSGNAIGVVQADEKFEHLISGVNTHIYQFIGLNLLGLTFITLMLFPLIKKIANHEEEQKRKLSNSLNEITVLSEQLKGNEKILISNSIKLEQTNRNLSDFANIVSHDLKAPLGNISSFANLLEMKDAQLDNEGKEFVHFIKSSSERALRLIDGLLNYSSIDENRKEHVYFNLRSAVSEAELGLKTMLEKRNVSLIINELPSVKSDPLVIAQIFQNLINNGIKYNQSKNPVIEIGTGQNSEKGIFVYIKDNGIGIKESNQTQIFDMFKRLHNRDQYDGSGIGLAFCQRIIDDFNGEIWLTSEENKGSTFYFTLPEMVVENGGVMLEAVGA